MGGTFGTQSGITLPTACTRGTDALGLRDPLEDEDPDEDEDVDDSDSSSIPAAIPAAMMIFQASWPRALSMMSIWK